mgnify:CR=1 FL=1
MVHPLPVQDDLGVWYTCSGGKERFVEAGEGIAAFDTRIGRIAMLICEEAFHSISGTVAALDGAELMLVLSASPARGAEPGPGMPGNVARWDLLGSGIAGEFAPAQDGHVAEVGDYGVVLKVFVSDTGEDPLGGLGGNDGLELHIAPFPVRGVDAA